MNTDEVPVPNVADLHSNPETMHLFLIEVNKRAAENAAELTASIAALEERIDSISFEPVAPKGYYAEKTNAEVDTTSIDLWGDVSGLSVTVSVAEGESILLNANVVFGHSATTRTVAVRILRDGNVISEGDADLLRTQTISASGIASTAVPYNQTASVVDVTPAAGDHVYTVQVRTDSGNFGINRSGTSPNNEDNFRTISTLHAIPIIKQ